MVTGPLTIRSRGYLPHWEVPQGTYAVTFRLADSLPHEVLRRLQRERLAIEETAAQMERKLTPQEKARLDVLYSEKIEAFLDSGAGACHLRNPKVGQMVFDALRHFHAERYTLYTWCVMPNHVHALFSPRNGHALKKIVQSWKSFSSNQANRILGREGTFWMPEYYDHLIRDKADFEHARQYILNNPKKAGLGSWPWVAELMGTADGGQDARVT